MTTIGGMLVSSRSLAEYRGMFALSPAELGGRILDCPGGAASLTAEVIAAGGWAVACDPVYARLGAAELGAHARAEVDRGNRYIREHPDEYRWSFFTDPDHHQRHRRAAVDTFTADRAAHPGRYLAAALPELPFREGVFDLVLCSHLLFSWADRLDPAFHRAAVQELVRVGTELRIFPLAPMGSTDLTGLRELRRVLSGDGVRTQVVDVDYELQAGCHQMLVCARGR